MKRILITGGAGFIGSNLCKRLVRNNYVICLDNLYSGKLSNIEDLFKYSNFKFINHDVRIPYFVECDEIYNLACPASPPFYLKDPIFTSDTCYLGAKHALECAKANNCKILLASTSEIYGNPLVHPLTEDYWGNVNPNGIRSCYDEGKRIAESLCCDYKRFYNVDIRIVRIFNTYGPYMRVDDGRVITNFISLALNNLDITVYGKGLLTRSLLYIDDLLDGFNAVMKNPYMGPVNLGNPQEITILDLAKTIIDLTNSKSKIVFKELPLDDPERRKPDITKIKTFWEPKIDLNIGLQKTITHIISI